MRLHLMKFNNKQALRFCTWENIMQEHRLGFPWGAALWKRPEDPGGQDAQWEWTVLLLQCQRKPAGRTSRAERQDRSNYPTSTPALSSTWKVLLFQAIPGILDSVLVPAIFIKKKKRGQGGRCGQAEEGPQKDHRDDPRTGKPAQWGNAERTGFVQPWKKGCLEETISSHSSNYRWLKRRWRLILQGATWKRWGHLLHIIPGQSPDRHKKNVFLNENNQPLE